jgi:tripartite motif-containing protein 2/3
MKNLDGAASNVTDEMRKLEEASERCVESAVKAFEEISSAVDRRRDDVIATVRRVRDEKKRVLREQLSIIESERCRVRADCDGLQVLLQNFSVRACVRV